MGITTIGTKNVASKPQYIIHSHPNRKIAFMRKHKCSIYPKAENDGNTNLLQKNLLF